MRKYLVLFLALATVAGLAAAQSTPRGVRPESLEIFDGFIERPGHFDQDLCDDATENTLLYNPSGLDNDWECDTLAAIGGGTIGDITDVGNCSTGDCASFDIEDGESIDFGANVTSATEGLFLPRHATDCSTAAGDGQVCYEQDADALYIGNGSVAKWILDGVALLAGGNSFTGSQFFANTLSDPEADDWEIGPLGRATFDEWVLSAQFAGEANEPTNIGAAGSDWVEFQDDDGFGYFDDDAFHAEETATPPTVASGYGAFWTDDSGNPRHTNDAAASTLLGDITSVGSGCTSGACTVLDGDDVSFDDQDSNFAATNVDEAIEELDDVNGSGPNAADGKVDWSQLVSVPAGFADGADADSGGDITSVFDCTSGACASFSPADGAYIDFGTNISAANEGLFIPAHATSCSSATGEAQVCWDENSDALVIGDGSTNVGFDKETEYCTVQIENAATSDDMFCGIAPAGGITLVGFECVATGSDPVALVMDVVECDTNGANCATSGMTATLEDVGDDQIDNSPSDGAVDADDWFGIHVTSTTTSPVWVACTLAYNPTR